MERLNEDIYIYISNNEEYDNLMTIKNNPKCEEFAYRPSFFGVGNGYFIYDNIYVTIEYDDMIGTFFRLSESIPEADVDKIYRLSREVFGTP